MTTPFFSLEGALFAEFEHVDTARAAVAELRARGYAHLETYSPFPLSSEQGRHDGRWFGLAIAVFAVAVVGGTVGYLVEWFTNAHSYPLNIGGRPSNAAPAFVYPAVEALILFAGISVVVGLLVALRLPRLWRPELEIEHFEAVSDDRFWIAIALGSGGGDLDRTTRELRALRATRVIHVVSES